MLKKIPFEAAYRVVVLLGLAAGMYLQTHYVPREEFRESQDSMGKKLAEIGASLALINTQMAIRASDKEVMQDHETRIRRLEEKLRNGQ